MVMDKIMLTLGDVNSRSVVNVEQGLKNAGFQIVTEAWLDECPASGVPRCG